MSAAEAGALRAQLAQRDARGECVVEAGDLAGLDVLGMAAGRAAGGVRGGGVSVSGGGLFVLRHTAAEVQYDTRRLLREAQEGA